MNAVRNIIALPFFIVGVALAAIALSLVHLGGLIEGVDQ